MKKITLLFLVLFLAFASFGQEKKSVVVLKNGTVLSGKIVELDPMSHLILNIAGYDTRIEMKDVASIEEEKSTAANALTQNTEKPETDYPETYTLKVGPYEIEMVLIEGGLFQMGYDGKNSIKFHSEPVHDVQLSPFYVNRRPISKEIVGYIKKGKEESGKSKSYHTIVWNDANNISEKLAEITEFPISLITEAQLEFISTSDSINKMDLEQGEQVLCLDFYAPYF